MKFRSKRYFPVLITLVSSFLLNCHSPDPAERPASEKPIQREKSQTPSPNSKPTSTEIPGSSSAPFELPASWSGTGVLLASKGALPRNAPDWARRAQLEIVLSEGTYFLRATSHAKNINNPSLLEQSVANRARAILQTTLQRPALSDSQIIHRWKNPTKAEMIVQVQTPIPSEWTQVAPKPDSMKDSSP